jgi:hypothetical protein
MRGGTAILSLCAPLIGSFPMWKVESLYAQQPPARSPTTFQEMSFVLPPGTWEQSPGSPPSLHVIFTRKSESGRRSTLGVTRVEYDLPMYGLSRTEHASKVLDLERRKARPYGVWRGFEQSTRTIGGSRYDVMSFQMLHPTEAAPTVVADGLFLVYFPADFESRERFYVLTWMDLHPPGEAKTEPAELDSVVTTFAVSAKGAAPSIPTFVVHAPLEKAWAALQTAVSEADLAVVTSDSTTHVVQTGVMVFSARNKLAGMGIGDVVDCGRNVGIARTRSGTTMVQLTATVRGTGDSSTVRVQLDTRNHDETSVFANKDRSCTSKGALERRLGARVEQLVKPSGSGS